MMQYRLLIFRLLCLTALAVSVAQLADHFLGNNEFCDPGEGCEQVTASVYGNPLGVPLSAVGAAGFLALFALSLVPTIWALRIVRVLGVLAGVVGAGLLIIQAAVLHRFCHLCVIVDSSSIGLAVLAVLAFPAPAPPNKFRLLGWVMVSVVVMLIPVCLASVDLPEPVPDEVKAHWQEGKITIVDVTDFDCPYCRTAHRNLKGVLKQQPEIRVVRLVCPLPLHEHAASAANAYFAASFQGKGDEMAELLYTANDLTVEGCENLAKELDLDLEKYRKDARDPETEGKYFNTRKWVVANRISLPAIWIQDQRLKGTPSTQEIVDAIAKARPWVIAK